MTILQVNIELHLHFLHLRSEGDEDRHKKHRCVEDREPSYPPLRSTGQSERSTECLRRRNVDEDRGRRRMKSPEAPLARHTERKKRTDNTSLSSASISPREESQDGIRQRRVYS